MSGLFMISLNSSWSWTRACGHDCTARFQALSGKLALLVAHPVLCCRPSVQHAVTRFVRSCKQGPHLFCMQHSVSVLRLMQLQLK